MTTRATKVPAFEIGARLDRGRVNLENQDFIGRAQAPLGNLLVLADGVGGHRGGRRAAELAVEIFLQFLQSLPAGARPDRALREAGDRANAQVYRLGHSGDETLKGMASTVVAAIVQGWQCWLGHVGDSRAYLFRAGQMKALTRDHSLAGSHVLTRGLGAKPNTDFEVTGPIALQPGDAILLCSDGLWSTVAHREMEAVMASGLSTQASVEGLVDLALEAGGPDNISVQCLRITGETNSATGGFLPKNEARTASHIAGSYKLAAMLAGLMVVAGVSWRIAMGPISAPVIESSADSSTGSESHPSTNTGSARNGTPAPTASSPSKQAATKPSRATAKQAPAARSAKPVSTPASTAPASTVPPSSTTASTTPAATSSSAKPNTAADKPIRAGLVIPQWDSPAWLSDVQSSEKVHVEKVEGSWPCWKLMRDKPQFFYTSTGKDGAAKLRLDAGLEQESRLEAMPSSAKTCAAGRDILIIPAAISWR